MRWRGVRAEGGFPEMEHTISESLLLSTINKFQKVPCCSPGCRKRCDRGGLCPFADRGLVEVLLRLRPDPRGHGGFVSRRFTFFCYGTGIGGGCFSRKGGGDGEDGEAVADLVLMLLIVILLKMLLLLLEVVSGEDIRGLSRLRVKVLLKKSLV